MRLNMKSKDFISMLGVGTLSLVAGIWVLGGFFNDISTPWADRGDLVAEYVGVVGISESGSSQIVSGFGWPFLMDNSSFLTTDWLSHAIYRLLLTFVEPIAAVNLYLLSTFFIIGTVTYVAWRILGFSIPTAFIVAISLAVIPWHIQRAFIHPSLSFYLAPPLLIALIVFYLKWQINNKNKYYIYSIFILLIISISHVYWWVFSLIFLLVFFIFRFTYYKNSSSQVYFGTIVLFLVIPVSVFVSYIYQKSISVYPLISAAVVRSFDQVERYSGSFISLFLPSPLSAIPFFSSIRNKYEKESLLTNLESSPWSSILAIVSLCVVIYIIFTLAFSNKDSLVRNKISEDNFENFLIKIFSLLVLVGLSFYWTTGLGNFSGLFLTDWVRSWGRIYIFIVYFAVAAAMLFFKNIFSQQLKEKNLKIGLYISLVTLIFIDQILTTYPSSANAAKDKYQEAQDFSKALSEKLEPGCPILQIPVFPYPEAGYNLYNFQDHEHFWLALSDRTRSYSYGANKATQQYLWQKNLEAEDTERLKLQAAAVGYCAIVVDLAAYESRVQEGNRWIEAIGAPLAVSSSARWAGWEVGEDFTNNQIRDLITLNWVGNFAAGNVQESIQIDFYDQEFSLYALNPTKEIANGVVSFEARSGTCTPSQTVRIVDVSNQLTIFETNLNKELTKISFEVLLEPREQKQYKFELASKSCTVEWWSQTKIAIREQKFSLAN
jgi:hypothetical protein